MTNAVSAQKLLEAGSHFGHQTRRWNPKMRKFIYGAKKGVHIIDLQKTVKMMDSAYAFVKETVAKGGEVIFVGTKKQAKEVVIEQAERAGVYYMAERWLGGTLTNFKTVSKSIKRMVDIERMEKDGRFDLLPKKEVIGLKKEHAKLEATLKGIRNMRRTPRIMFVVDPTMDTNAIAEARKLGMKIVAIADTNCDPELIDFPIPANDDAIKSVKLITTAIADACIDAKGGKLEIAFTADEPREFVPRTERPQGDRPFNKDGRRPYGDRPQGDRPQGDRPFNKDFRKPYGDRPQGDRPRFDNNRPRFEKPAYNAANAAPKAVEVKVEAPKAAPQVDLSAKTLTDLKDIAKAKGLKGYSTLKKAEIIDLINKA